MARTKRKDRKRRDRADSIENLHPTGRHEFDENDHPQDGEEWVLLPTGKNIRSAKYHKLWVYSVELNQKGEKFQRGPASWQRWTLPMNTPKWVQLIDEPFIQADEEEIEAPKTKAERFKLYLLNCIKLTYWSWKTPYVHPTIDCGTDSFYPLLYQHNDYASYASNELERRGHTYSDFSQSNALHGDFLRYRSVMPRCLMGEPKRTENTGDPNQPVKFQMPVQRWSDPSRSPPSNNSPMSFSQSSAPPPYVFISYLTRHFSTQTPSGKTVSPTLLELANHIVRSSNDENSKDENKVQFHWMACYQNFNSEGDDEVYHIADYVRSAKSVVIALPHEAKIKHGLKRQDGSPVPPNEAMNAFLREWGMRLWTLPEILLSRDKGKIKVFFANEAIEEEFEIPFEIGWYELAAIAWADAPISRALVDHYLSTINLGRLELASIALQCFRNRECHEENLRPADVIYAFMGLLRIRIEANAHDSALVAFARLSLRNDSDRLIERCVCMQPPQWDRGSWLSLRDEYDCHLWQINPACEIAGVCRDSLGDGAKDNDIYRRSPRDDTIILDGARGAPIRWDGFPKTLAYKHNGPGAKKLRRTIPRLIICILLFAVGCYAMANRKNVHAMRGGIAAYAFSFLFLLWALKSCFWTPYRLRKEFEKLILDPGLCLMGIEGYLPLRTLERRIFGRAFDKQILRWDPYGSTLCAHEQAFTQRNTDRWLGECWGRNPTTDPDIAKILSQADNSRVGDCKVFTLINFYSRTVMLFLARRPPVAAIICGSEGGMQRVVLCSHDWVTNGLYREAVVRMNTPTKDLMPRLQRFKFGFRWRTHAEVGIQQNDNGMDGFRSTRKEDSFGRTVSGQTYGTTHPEPPPPLTSPPPAYSGDAPAYGRSPRHVY